MPKTKAGRLTPQIHQMKKDLENLSKKLKSAAEQKNTKKAMQKCGGKVLFTHLQPQIKKVFDILNALPSLQVFTSIEELDNYLDTMQKKAR